MPSHGWHVCVNSDFPFSTCSVSDCTLPTFAICCFDVAVIFFLRCHWALTTAKCGFRETAHQNTWRAKDCHYTTNDVFPSVASKNGFQLQPDLATDTVHPIFLAELDQSLISMCMNLGLVWQLLETCHPAPPSNLIASLINGRRRYF